MSDKASLSRQGNLGGGSSAHDNAIAEAVTTALSWLTTLPSKGTNVFDHITGRCAIATLPVAGLVLTAGAILITVGLFVASSSRMPALYDVTSILGDAPIVVAARMMTRAMHLDGLADVADALGSYKPPEGAWEVLCDPSTGPMGVGSTVLMMLTTATASAGIVASVLAQWSDGQA